jgi:hypothetical protein
MTLNQFKDSAIFGCSDKLWKMLPFFSNLFGIHDKWRPGGGNPIDSRTPIGRPEPVGAEF